MMRSWPGVWCRHEPPRSCGSQRLMTRVEARACHVIILDPAGAGRAVRRRSAPGNRAAWSAGLPGHDPRPTRPQRASSPADRHPRTGRRRAGRCPVVCCDRRMGPGCAPAHPCRAGPPKDPLTGVWVVPAEATIRRTLDRLDAQALAEVIGAWLADRDPGGGPTRQRRAVAVDGKTLRGARAGAGGDRPVHLLACMEQDTRGAGPTPGRRRARGSARPGRAAGATEP